MKTTTITVHTYPEQSTIQVKMNGIYRIEGITFRDDRPRFVIPTIIKIVVKIKWNIFKKWAIAKLEKTFEELI